jgi:hypothetical protein
MVVDIQLALRTCETAGASDKENIEFGVITWGTLGLQGSVTTSTIRSQLTTTSDLNEVSSIIEANMYPEGLLERRIVWVEGP